MIGRYCAQQIIKGNGTYEFWISKFPDYKEDIDWWLDWYGYEVE